MSIPDPPPQKPGGVVLPGDVKAYALWLDRQVNALDKAVQAYVQNPLQPFSQREAVQFVVTVGKGISWNKWLLSWKQFAAHNGVIVFPLLPIPIEMPMFDWNEVQRYHVELEGWRSQFQSLGVPVPGATELPGEKKPPLESAETIAIAGGVIAGALLVGYLVHKFT